MQINQKSDNFTVNNSIYTSRLYLPFTKVKFNILEFDWVLKNAFKIVSLTAIVQKRNEKNGVKIKNELDKITFKHCIFRKQKQERIYIIKFIVF